jgi:hypothetical protein
MAVSIDIPCIKLPEVPEIPNIQLFAGVELNGFLDFSTGIPDDCKVTFNLLAQLAPTLAGLAPILNILCVLQALAAFATNPLTKGPDLIKAIEKLASMFISLTPAGIAVTIKGILELIIKFLNCFITALESNITLQAEISLSQQNIELNVDLGNPVLEASLKCAMANAELAMQHTMASLGPIEPILSIVNMIAGIAGLSLELPALSVSADQDLQDLTETLTSMRNTITSLQQVIDSLPL